MELMEKIHEYRVKFVSIEKQNEHENSAIIISGNMCEECIEYKIYVL